MKRELVFHNNKHAWKGLLRRRFSSVIVREKRSAQEFACWASDMRCTLCRN